MSRSVASFRLLAVLVLCAPASGGRAADYPQPLAEEAVGTVEVLPPAYPRSWILVQDLHFDSIPDGRVAIVDVAAENRNLKGQIPVGQLGNVLAARTRPEIYVAETYYSRLTRGERTDVVTIWDAATLAPKGEIVLPGGKRGQFVTLANSFQLTNDERWALVFNFTPAASVTVVDLQARAVLSEIDLPGCSLIYPTGARGFASLCADGTVVSIALDEAGKVASTTNSKRLNAIDDDPMFMTPAMVGRTAWFATFQGKIHGIDLSGPVAKDLGAFSLPKPAGGAPEWRPGGWQVITADVSGLLYVLMSPHGREGSHKDGGEEVWVVDPGRKALVRRITLKGVSTSIVTSQETSPSLVASRSDGSLDVYDARSGALKRTIVGTAHDPMTMMAAR